MTKCASSQEMPISLIFFRIITLFDFKTFYNVAKIKNTGYWNSLLE